MKYDNWKHLNFFPGFYVEHRMPDILGVSYIEITRNKRLHFVLFPLLPHVTLLASLSENNSEMNRYGYCIAPPLL